MWLSPEINLKWEFLSSFQAIETAGPFYLLWKLWWCIDFDSFWDTFRFGAPALSISLYPHLALSLSLSLAPLFLSALLFPAIKSWHLAMRHLPPPKRFGLASKCYNDYAWSSCPFWFAQIDQHTRKIRATDILSSASGKRQYLYRSHWK